MKDFSEPIKNAQNTIGDLTSKTAKSVAQVAEQAKTALNETLHQATITLSESADKASENITNATTNTVKKLNDATTSVAQVAEQAKTALNETLHQATITLSESADKASENLTNATTNTVQKLNDATTSVAQVAEQTKTALNETLHQAEQISESLTNSVQDVIITSLKTWMSSHPFIAWMINHPLWTFIFFLLTIFLGWGLFRALGKSIEQFWLSIFKIFTLPFVPLYNGFSRLTKFPNNKRNINSRLPEIFKRLETIKKEQDLLMEELQSILTNKNS